MTPGSIFATGIENSDATAHGGRARTDKPENYGHSTHRPTDFNLIEEMGLPVRRHAPPLHRTGVASGRYDWSMVHAAFADLHWHNLMPMIDLCHFGVPDWIGNLQQPNYAGLLAKTARSSLHRYPWVQLYTPANEMYTCALLSGAYGWRDEQLQTDRGNANAPGLDDLQRRICPVGSAYKSMIRERDRLLPTDGITTPPALVKRGSPCDFKTR